MTSVLQKEGFIWAHGSKGLEEPAAGMAVGAGVERVKRKG